MTKISVAKKNIPTSGNDTAKLIDIIIKSIQEKKGQDIICMNLKNCQGAVCDFFIICHGNSTTQVDAIGGFIYREVFKKHKDKPSSKEGFENSQWILLDYFDVVVHIFLPEQRSFYDIESLWADGETIRIKENRNAI